MRRACIFPVIAAALLVTTPVLGSEPERYEDAIGDATGDSPDIVAVTVSEPEGEPGIRFEIELAPGRPFGTDMETWTDVLFLFMSPLSEVDERGILAGDQLYYTGTHAVTLEAQRDAGAMLGTPEGELYWYVVDTDADDTSVSFTFDRKLLDSPLDLYWQVLLGVERFDEMESGGDGESEMEGDVCPELDQPPAKYRLGATDR